MPMIEQPTRYGTMTRWLHWSVALLLFWQLGGMIMKNVLGRIPLMKFWVGTHTAIGLLILAIVIVRLVWAFRERGQRPAYHAGAIGFAARAGHWLLYLLMFLVPALALLRLIGSGKGLMLFGLQIIPAGGDKIAWMAAPANALHGTLAWALLALIIGHVAMVLVHRFWWRDDILPRMWGR